MEPRWYLAIDEGRRDVIDHSVKEGDLHFDLNGTFPRFRLLKAFVYCLYLTKNVILTQESIFSFE
jgi:hypothetical protein